MSVQVASYPVIGIGLSAGGLDALRELLSYLPSPAGATFVVVPHLPIGHESHFDQVIGRVTSLQVAWAANGAIPQPEHLYVLPPQYELGFQEERFRLIPRQNTEKINRMVDRGFAALAQAFGRRTIGIVLSGTGSDGVAGVKAIEHKGGIVMAQHPKTAKFEGMPASVIAHDHPDMIGTPQQLADLLINHLPYSQA
ncbi:two-component system, chemotaxis family, CheB/CheR fusion protein [Catalinimonas alkaloidigena]|uniref:protein-glutamate methylesterase n=1 Tax=Catalinimonas alkaloidigena TaxID=1075417 RepID=A0A1G8XI04_9BACT|nr:chemotaxis protein CheB [Catalinimonas alkaloidigena]SDJ90047.1 two-component system, chemotaxis family, CheB/CheR fusion protein [Catalinimonas alkaloidigena]